MPNEVWDSELLFGLKPQSYLFTKALSPSDLNCEENQGEGLVIISKSDFK